MKSLVLGGIKCGKSRYAESLARDYGNPVSVIATARADDAEMAARISKHKADRDNGWHLVEEPLALGSAISEIAESHTIVVDCLTLWLTNLLLLDDSDALETEKSRFLDSLRRCSQQMIIVSNETSMGIVPMGELSRRYCDEAGLMHQEIAACCDHVVLIIAGLPQVLKSG